MSEIFRRARLVRASTVTTTRQKFLLDPLYPEGTLSLIGAIAGIGKSTLTIHHAAQATCGTLHGDHLGKKLNVLILAPEDSHTIQKLRLQAAGANLDRVFFLEMEETRDGYTVQTGMSLPRDIDSLTQVIAVNDISLVIIDPITSVVPGDTNRRDDVRTALDPLLAAAQELQIAIVGILHFSKGGGRASDKISGSHAWRDVTRSLVLLAQDADTGTRVVTLDKSSYSSNAGQSWQFDITTTSIQTDDGELQEIGRVTGWSDTELSVQEIINRDPFGQADDEDRHDAQAFILDYLEGNGGEAPAGDILKAGRAAGFNDTDLKNARKRSKAPRVTTRKASFGAGWVWAIALEGVTDTPQGVQGVALSDTTPSTPSHPEMTPSEQICPVCLERMTPIPGLTTHPTCQPHN